jgi:twitching motility two-component system response regulator PilH
MHTPEPIHGTILVVDQGDQLGKEKAMLEQVGFTVLTADSVAQGVAMAREQRPDLVLSEVMLDKPDAGFVLGYRIKHDPNTADIPVVLLSSIFTKTGFVFDLSSPEARQWIKADAYIERPITNERLEARLRQVMHKHE